MTIECYRCGLEVPECHCYLYELEERISNLEEGLDQLTEVFKKMSDHIRKDKDER